jgi:hypothetical protein
MLDAEGKIKLQLHTSHGKIVTPHFEENRMDRIKRIFRIFLGI